MRKPSHGPTSCAVIVRKLGLRCSIFGDTLATTPYLISTALRKGHHSYFNNQLHIMPSDTATSILEDALACIGQRIASILMQPAKKDNNYIASLYNEVVGIF